MKQKQVGGMIYPLMGLPPELAELITAIVQEATYLKYFGAHLEAERH